MLRRDVLVRHTSSVHGIVTKHRKPSCVNCALQKLKCDGDQDDKCKRCDHLQLECVYKQPKSSSRASEPPRKRARTSPSSPERDPSEAGSLPSVESSAHPVQHLAPAIMPPPPLFHHQPTPSTSTSRRPLPPPATNVPEASPFASTSSAAPAYLAQRPAPQPASPLWQPAYNFSAERTSAALSNMARTSCFSLSQLGKPLTARPDAFVTPPQPLTFCQTSLIRRPTWLLRSTRVLAGALETQSSTSSACSTSAATQQTAHDRLFPRRLATRRLSTGYACWAAFASPPRPLLPPRRRVSRRRAHLPVSLRSRRLPLRRHHLRDCLDESRSRVSRLTRR